MWIVLALVTAVCTALRDVASKHATARADAVVVALGVAGVPAITLGAIVLLRGVVAPGDGFWAALAISGGINAVATPLIVVALRRSDLSLVAPVTSLTPLFMIGTGAVVLGEMPGPLGILGVSVIVVGAYMLSLSERHAGPLEPLRALVRDPGSRAMLFVAFFYAISGTYDKVGTGASSPLMWAASINAASAAVLAPFAWWRWRRWRRTGVEQRVSGSAVAGPGARVGAVPAILLAGLFTAIGAAAQMTALMMTLAAFVIAVKRTSTLFGVLLGHSMFREERVRERLLGAAVMLAGFVLVTLG